MKPRKNLAISITLLVLAVLIFSGCGERNAGSVTEPSTSSSIVVSSPSGTVTAVESGAAVEYYSGGSKAPDGEYRPVDEQGPAQNVPKPVKPEGINEETAEGLKKFIGYWVESVNYGTQTGDFSYVIPLVSESHTADIEYFAWTENLYANGGWKAGGLRNAVLGDSLMINQGDGTYTWGGNLLVQDSYTYFNNEMSFTDNSSSRTDGIIFIVEYKNGQWLMAGIDLADGQI